jgi:hypothetical protein
MDMPFLDWFKRKSERTAAEAPSGLIEKFDVVPTDPLETIAAHSEQANEQPANEPTSTDLLPDGPQNLPVDSGLSPSETDALPATRHLSVPIGAFYAKLPVHLLVPKAPDFARLVQIAEEDVVFAEDAEEVTLALSILSLSCPEIFIRAVERSDDIPITFFVGRVDEMKSPAIEPSNTPEETETSSPRVEDRPVQRIKKEGEPEIKLRLQPILADFPPQVEPPAIHSPLGTEAEIALPLDLIQSQLEHGRVVVSAEMFCQALPDDLKPYFATIDPEAEVPIPLQEIFSRLEPSAIQLREDQEMDHPEETIPTPFTEHAEEDAKRFAQVPVEAPPSAEETQPSDEPLTIAVESDSERLQAIFLTDEPLDLARTIRNVAALPGLRSCLLSTTAGLKLAGSFDGPEQEKAITTLLPDLFSWTGSKLETLQAGTLETITLYYSQHQLSAFVRGNLCLTVLHDQRPFKPGVREKIQAVMSELVALSASGRTV